MSLLLTIRVPGRFGEGIGRGFRRGTNREPWAPGTGDVGSWGSEAVGSQLGQASLCIQLSAGALLAPCLCPCALTDIRDLWVVWLAKL